jgi:hypothetical protein
MNLALPRSMSTMMISAVKPVKGVLL